MHHSALDVKQIPKQVKRRPDPRSQTLTTWSDEAALLTALAVDGSVGSELGAGSLDVGVVSGVWRKTANHGTGRALLVEEVVGVLGLHKGLGLAGQGVGPDERSSEDGTSKVVVFALGPD